MIELQITSNDMEWCNFIFKFSTSTGAVIDKPILFSNWNDKTTNKRTLAYEVGTC